MTAPGRPKAEPSIPFPIGIRRLQQQHAVLQCHVNGGERSDSLSIEPDIVFRDDEM
ncbi:Hypothetical protein A7982_07962 [Minicystis rosea]|nr:Hypothetical protein A7982_07962 [Minicystis rosea]